MNLILSKLCKISFCQCRNNNMAQHYSTIMKEIYYIERTFRKNKSSKHKFKQNLKIKQHFNLSV